MPRLYRRLEGTAHQVSSAGSQNGSRARVSCPAVTRLSPRFLWFRSYDGAVLAELPIIRINVQAETAEEYISAAARRFGEEFFVPTNEELGDRVRIEAPFLGGSVGVHGEAIATPAIIDGRKGYYLRLIDLDRDSVMIMIPGPPDEAKPALKIPKSRDTPPLPLPIVKPAPPASPTAAEMKSITQTQPFRIAEKLPGVATAPPPGGAPLSAPEKPTEAAKADAAAKFEAAKAVMAAKAEAAKADAAKADAKSNSKTDDAKAEAAKADSKADDTKAEQATSDSKAQDAPAERAKSDSKAGVPKQDAPGERAKSDSKAGVPKDAPGERAKSDSKAGVPKQDAPGERAKSDSKAGVPKQDAVRADGTYGAAWAASKSGGVKVSDVATDAPKTDAATSEAKTDATKSEAKTDAAKTGVTGTSDAPKSATPTTDSDLPPTAKVAVTDATAESIKARPASPTNTEPTAPAIEPAAASVAAATPVDSRRRVAIVVAASFAMVALTIFLVTRRSPKPAATNVATVQRDAPLAPEPPPPHPVDEKPTEVVQPPVEEPKTTRVGGGRNAGSATDATNARGSNAANPSGNSANTGANTTTSGSTTATSSGSNTAANTATSSGSNTATSGSNAATSTGTTATSAGSNTATSATTSGSNTATTSGNPTTSGSGGKAGKAVAAPQNLSPRDSARITCKFGTEIELVWVAVPGATGYSVEVARDASFSSVAATIETDTTVGIFRPMAPGIFHWRVTAKTATGRSEPSGSRQFTCNAD